MVDPETIERAADAPEAEPDEFQPEPGVDTPKTEKPAWGVRLYTRLIATPIEVVVLTVLAIVTRFGQIQSPNAIVFDEVYFREYSLHYKAGPTTSTSTRPSASC